MAVSHLVVVALLISVACAHLCLISPPQRGSMQGLNTAASADCFLTTGPCGNRPVEEPPALVVIGQHVRNNFTITWQKNENHWTQANPGTFTVSIASIKTPTKFVPIYSEVDTNTPALTLYSYAFNASGSPFEDQVILQVRYDAPSLPAVFYQCVDMFVYH